MTAHTKRTDDILKKRKLKPLQRRKFEPVEKKIFYTEGYSSLQYFGLIRRYIQRKYGLHIQDLELLLFLYPYHYFTHKDFVKFPYTTTIYKMSDLFKRGFFQEILDINGKSRKRNRLYAFTKLTDKIIKDFYELMAREKTLSLLAHANPLTKKQKDMPNNEKYLKRVRNFHNLFNEALSRQEKEQD